MKNFERLAENVDIAAILTELARELPTWTQEEAPVHAAVDPGVPASLALRGLRASRILGRRRRDVHDTRYTRAAALYSSTISLLEDLAAKHDATVGRARLVRLGPHAGTPLGSDRGAYYRSRDRYRLVLHSGLGSRMVADEESVRMRNGELWWYDHKSQHRVLPSADARIHLDFDLEPRNAVHLRSHCSPTYAVAGDLGTALTEADECAAALEGHTIGASGTALRAEAELVAACTRLYLSGCAAPRRWASLLDVRGAGKLADSRPLRALAQAVLEVHRPERTRPLALALGWALAQLDEGVLSPPEMTAAVVEQGGLDAIARAWGERVRNPAQTS